MVYVSGDSGYEWAARGVPHSVMAAKPFHPAEGVTALSAPLDQEESRYILHQYDQIGLLVSP